MSKKTERPARPRNGEAGRLFAPVTGSADSRHQSQLHQNHEQGGPPRHHDLTCLFYLADGLVSRFEVDEAERDAWVERCSGHCGLVSEALTLAERFEAWSATHLDFDQCDECWPYYLEDAVAGAFTTLIRARNSFQLTDADFHAVLHTLKPHLLKRT